MALTKIVNGVSVPMSAEEEAAILAEREASANRPPPVPRSVTPLQIRRALRAGGLLEAVTEYVGSQPAEVQEAWEYAVAVYREDAMLTAAAAALDKTEAEVDDLFRLAATK